MRHLQPVVLHTWLDSANCWGILAKHMAFLRGVIVSSIRDCFKPLGWTDKIHYFLIANATDLVMANSFAAKSQLQCSQPFSEVRVIHNGIDPKQFDTTRTREEVRSELKIGLSKVIIGTVGRMVAVKNHVMLVDIARRLSVNWPDVHFVIVGDGSLKPELEGRIRDAGLADRFTLTGQRNDIANLLKVLDIFILTSISEALPNVIMEAMCAGLPVVSTAVGGVPELIEDGENGILVPSGDVHASTAALESLLADPKERARLGEEAQRTIEKRFAMKRMVESTATVYDELIAAVARRKPRLVC